MGTLIDPIPCRSPIFEGRTTCSFEEGKHETILLFGILAAADVLIKNRFSEISAGGFAYRFGIRTIRFESGSRISLFPAMACAFCGRLQLFPSLRRLK
jgi:hypothetical protein